MTGKSKDSIHLTDIFKQLNKVWNKEERQVPLTYTYIITHKLNIYSAEYLTDHRHKLLLADADLTHCCTYCSMRLNKNTDVMQQDADLITADILYMFRGVMRPSSGV